jgi:hypothetical protein
MSEATAFCGGRLGTPVRSGDLTLLDAGVNREMHASVPRVAKTSLLTSAGG